MFSVEKTREEQCIQPDSDIPNLLNNKMSVKIKLFLDEELSGIEPINDNILNNIIGDEKIENQK